LKSISARKPVYGGAAGVAFTTNVQVIRVGYRHEETYNPAAAQSVCVPANLGLAGAFTCTSLVIGPPSRSRKNLIDGEYRAAFAKFISASVAISYNIDHGVTGIDIPVWMIPDASGSFGGGVRFGYRSDSRKHPTLSIFVGHFKL